MFKVSYRLISRVGWGAHNAAGAFLIFSFCGRHTHTPRGVFFFIFFIMAALLGGSQQRVAATPLVVTADEVLEPIVRLLLKAGADGLMIDKEGDIALACARRGVHELKVCGRDRNDPKSRPASHNLTAKLPGLVLGCFEADSCK